MGKTMRGWTWRVACLIGATISLLAGLAGLAFPQYQYRIGPEDVLHIAVLGNKDLEMDVTVQPDGRISFPMAGEVQAGGLTIAQLAEELTRRIRTLVRDALVGVTVKEINSYNLFLVGAVNRQGPFRVRSEITLIQLLSMAGGAAQYADLGQAYIVRKNQKIPVNVKKLLDEGDASQNPVLLPEDTVVIPTVPGAPPPGVTTAAAAPLSPESQVVYVMGQVQRPGAIPFTRDLNVVKALALAGGFTTFASPSRVRVIREEESKKALVSLRVDVSDILKGGGTQDVILQAGDVINVPESLF